MRECSVPNCTKRHYAKNLCNMHYMRLRTTGAVGAAEPSRFISDGYCSIEGCNKPHLAKGLCIKHYTRMERTGVTNIIGTIYGEPLEYLKGTVLKYQNKKKCLIWPYGRDANGYGRIQYKGKGWLVSRLVCRKVHGKPPTPKHQSRHTCGKGHEGCVNPWHVIWGTAKENAQDKIAHETIGHKLTDSKVIKIFELINAGYSNADIGRKFKVTSTNISYIRSGKIWKHVERRHNGKQTRN